MSGARPVRVLRRSGRSLPRRVAARRLVRALACFRAPRRLWSLKRRLMGCVALAAGAFAAAAYGWRVVDADVRAKRAAQIESLERRLQESRAKLARLPQLREAASASRVATGATGPSERSAWQAVADLADRSGVKLLSLEPAQRPAAPRGRNAERGERALRLDGRTDFEGLRAFVRGLSALPMVIAPSAVDIKAEPDGLAFGASLNLRDGPPAPQILAKHGSAGRGLAGGDAGGATADPFQVGAAGSSRNAEAVRLVGLLHDERQALAILAGASGAQAAVAARGQALGAERIVHIDALGVTLSGRGGARRLTWSEGER